MSSLSSISAPLIFLGGIVLAVAAACGGQIVVRRRFNTDQFATHNEVAGFIVTVAGTLFAVVLGFVTVVVWEQYRGSEERVSVETAAAGDAWHVAVGLPPPIRTRVRRDMLTYGQLMVADEWPLMRSGRFSSRADSLIMDATDAVGTFDPPGHRESNAQAIALTKLAELHDARSRRLASNAFGVSGIQWGMLLVGAFVVIGFCWLFGVSNERVHLMMTSAVAVIVASMFVLIFELQYPFRGALGIPPNAWTGFLQHVRYMDTRGMPSMRM
ncbi:MAG: hypothetical protein JWO66_1669 [Candidatus Eremiobacteraeota bacterium]|nr:hypothetical protein [Candidatus Eremiobacteraeota bacterium]